MTVSGQTFQAMGDETRLRVLACLSLCGKPDDVCVCELADCLRVKSSTLSSHLNILRHAGLVKTRKDGTWVYYRLADDLPPYLLEAIQAVGPSQEDEARLRGRLALRVAGKCCVPVGALTDSNGERK